MNKRFADIGYVEFSTARVPPPQNPTTHFLLDPRDAALGPSRETIQDEVEKMLDLVRTRLTVATNTL